jgi:hypothetical protein
MIHQGTAIRKSTYRNLSDGDGPTLKEVRDARLKRAHGKANKKAENLTDFDFMKVEHNPAPPGNVAVLEFRYMKDLDLWTGEPLKVKEDPISVTKYEYDNEIDDVIVDDASNDDYFMDDNDYNIDEIDVE